jgi:hypothetical protein
MLFKEIAVSIVYHAKPIRTDAMLLIDKAAGSYYPTL